MKNFKYNTNFKEPKNISNNNLQKIIQFYLFECPVEGKSHRGKTFKEYGYIGSKAFGVLKSKLLNAATPSLSKNYMPSQKDQLPDNFKKCEKITYPDEYCVFIKNDKNGVISSLFSAIRNSFAHGSFNVKAYNKTRIYYFSNYKQYEKARIVLYEDTLLSWINIIKH